MKKKNKENNTGSAATKGKGGGSKSTDNLIRVAASNRRSSGTGSTGSGTTGSSSSTNAARFEDGDRVRIVVTSYTQTRLPHLLHAVGIVAKSIRGITGDPGTVWAYRIKFSDTSSCMIPSTKLEVALAREVPLRAIDLVKVSPKSKLCVPKSVFQKHLTRTPTVLEELGLSYTALQQTISVNANADTQEEEGGKKEGNDYGRNGLLMNNAVLRHGAYARYVQDNKPTVQGMVLSLNAKTCTLMVNTEGLLSTVSLNRVDITPMTLTDYTVESAIPEFWTGRQLYFIHGKFRGHTGLVLHSKPCGWVEFQMMPQHGHTMTRLISSERLKNVVLFDQLPHLDDRFPTLSASATQVVRGRIPVTPKVTRQTLATSCAREEESVVASAGTHTSSNAPFLLFPPPSLKVSCGTPRSNPSLKPSSIMWIDRKVVLPDATYGMVKSITHGRLSVETPDGRLRQYRKEELELCLEIDKEAHLLMNCDDNQAGENSMSSSYVPIAVHGEGFTEQVKRHVTKQMDLFKKRPNLKEWVHAIDAESVTTGAQDATDASVRDFLPIFSCEVCLMEKERSSGSCWNTACPISPVFIKESAVSEVMILTSTTTTQRNRSIDFSLAATKKMLRCKVKPLHFVSGTSPRRTRFNSVSEDNLDAACYRWHQRVAVNYENAATAITTTTTSLKNTSDNIGNDVGNEEKGDINVCLSLEVGLEKENPPVVSSSDKNQVNQPKEQLEANVKPQE